MGRLIVISNRLPFSCEFKDGEYRFAPSSGGLVSALSGYLEAKRKDGGARPEMGGLINALIGWFTRKKEAPQFLWVGWPGTAVDPKKRQAVKNAALKEHGAWPVFLEPEEADRFYLGFCNSTLWPLFHYFPNHVTYDPDSWQAYLNVNARFRDAVLEVVQPGDTIWIHDYQLLLLPGLLRERLPDHPIGFFLHIPFPSFELFRLLPDKWRKRILGGMMGADLIGFHTYDYTQYFLRCIFRTLGYNHHLGQIRIEDQLRRADTFPIGIDFAKFESEARGPAVQARLGQLRAELGNRKVLFSVDRLDYTKGILHRLHGYEEFLLLNPDWLGRIVFVLSIVPSREEVPQYLTMKRELDETVGRLNGRFGRSDWVPLLYHYRHMDFTDLVANYCLADVALITPLRDGMNLVAKEYLACQVEDKGVLILSEMAGAARELGEAVLVNPNHRGEVAEAILEALNMPEAERIRRSRPMRERIRTYDATHWAEGFISGLDRIQAQKGSLTTQHLVGNSAKQVRQAYQQARSPFLFLDYDGTLVDFASLPQLAVPDPALIDLLQRLISTGSALYLVSGRDRAALQGWFGNLEIGLVAEHGAWMRKPGEDWQSLKPALSTWKETLRPIFLFYVDRLPGSLLEEKESTLAWHYRNADPELAATRAKELIDDLVQYTANFDVQVLEGRLVVEVRPSGVHKGAAILHVLEKANPDFIFAIGDDQTDEDMFRSLPAYAVTVRVGSRFSQARYSLRNVDESRAFLAGLTERPGNP